MLFKMPKGSIPQQQLYRCDQMCAETSCSCNSPHPYDEDVCNKKCTIFPKAKCVEYKGNGKIIPKSELKKLKKNSED